MIEDRFSPALEIFNGIRQTDSESMSGASDQFFDVEYMYCMVKLGRLTKTEFLSHNIDVASAATLDCDDRVVFLSELLAIYDEFSILDMLATTSQLLSEAASAYVDDTMRLKAALQGIVYSENQSDH